MQNKPRLEIRSGRELMRDPEGPGVRLRHEVLGVSLREVAREIVKSVGVRQRLTRHGTQP
jgi:hypothetical protein